MFSCEKTYILDKKIYVPAGKSLTINPGTVIKGRTYSTADSATALIVSRGGQIFAAGDADCQIVFTAEADNLSGTYSFDNKGKWGGLVLCGKATNNLTLAANGPYTAGSGNGRLAKANGLGVIEGFATDNPSFYFGADLTGGESFDDNDNSGVLKYVSIRHSGANLTVGGEINGLTLGSVGRGTIIDNVEIVSCADDGIEFFGGTVNVTHIAMLFGNDDNFDWDDGWVGKAQFLFVLKTDTMSSKDSDNGFEADGDDQKSNLLPRSHPVIYNATMIGNNKTALSSDNSSIAAINAKEITEGEIYNSVFANWKNGLNMVKSLGTRTGTSEAYHNWSNSAGNGSNSLKVKCNTFVGVTNPITVGNNGVVGTGPTAADTAQFYTTDMNIATGTVSGFDYQFTVNNMTNAISHQPDAVPNPALSVSGCATAPVDGFYEPAAYRGAFSTNGKNWLSEWSYAAVVAVIGGLQACPTDLNADGVTNNIDFLQLLGQFGQSCD